MKNNKPRKSRSVKVSVAKLENLSWWFKPPVLSSMDKRNSLRVAKS